MGKLLIKFKERNLLVNSKVTEDYPQLIKFIENTPNLKESQLETLPSEMQSFFTDMYPIIIKQASGEWAADNQYPIDILDDENMVRCQLCNTKIKYICYIVNKISGNRLEVGRECVKHFGLVSDTTIAQLFKEMAKIKKLEGLNVLLPGINRVIQSWDRKLDSYSILIPLNMKSPYLKLGERANALFQEYTGEQKLAKGRKEEIIDEFKEIFRQREILLNNIEKYIISVKDEKYMPTRRIVNWLKKKRSKESDTAITWLEEDGKIAWRTIFRIDEPNFMKSIVNDLNEHLIQADLKVEKMDTELSGYVIIYARKPDIKLFCQYSKLLLDYGWLLFDENRREKERLTLHNVIKICTIHKDEQSIDAFFRSISLLLKKFNITLVQTYPDYDDVAFYDKDVRNYIVVGKLMSMINSFLGLPFNVGDKTEEELIQYITTPQNTRYTSADFRDFEKKREKSFQYTMR